MINLLVIVIFGGGFVPFDDDDMILVLSLFIRVNFSCRSFWGIMVLVLFWVNLIVGGDIYGDYFNFQIIYRFDSNITTMVVIS